MKKAITESVVIVLAFSMILISDTYARTIKATSCSRTDVQSAIDTSADGDTVSIPAGSCT